jgi:NAD(P)-dependent dehydrogenase (short-subunit alcohol dehydrogenase family)
MLDSLPRPFTTCVFGASGGIGAAVTTILTVDSPTGPVFAGSRLGKAQISLATEFAFDLEDEESIVAAAALVRDVPPLRLVFVATGQLHDKDFHPEKSWRDQSPDAYARAFAVNATGPALIGKHFLPLLPREGKSVFAALSARVSSISDNRLGGWHAYRASKAALNMIVANFARELVHGRKEAIAVTLHPGTVDTALSAPFQRGVPEGKLFTPEFSARQLLDVIDGLEPKDSGGLFAWDGEQVTF